MAELIEKRTYSIVQSWKQRRAEREPNIIRVISISVLITVEPYLKIFRV